jgi:HSP20 family protein
MIDTKAPLKTANGHLETREPLGFIEELEQELDHLFRTPLAFRGSFVWPFRRPGTMQGMWAPRMDVFEKDGMLVVKAELPGLKKEDVTVEIDGENLVIRGHVKTEAEVKQENYYRIERSSGSFYRHMPLPEGVTAEQIEATLVDGVLEVHIPKAVEKPETTKIEVK